MGKWADYLELLESKGKDWTDPSYLMQAFGITERAAQQVIDRRMDEIDARCEAENEQANDS